MTSRDRIAAALNHIQPDRTPIFEYVFTSPMADVIVDHKHISYDGDMDIWQRFVAEVGLKQAITQYVSDRLKIAEVLGHDMIYVCPNPVQDSDKEIDRSKNITSTTLQEIDDPVKIVKSKNESKRQ